MDTDMPAEPDPEAVMPSEPYMDTDMPADPDPDAVMLAEPDPDAEPGV